MGIISQQDNWMNLHRSLTVGLDIRPQTWTMIKQMNAIFPGPYPEALWFVILMSAGASD